ncbi:MAG: MMPL family transporter [Legionella sp.]|nr:MMPL family transporter [Legionella sp.]
MQGSLFYRLGQWIYRFHWQILFLWLCAVIACLPLLPHLLKPFKSTGLTSEIADSTRTQQYLDKKLGYLNHNKFIIIYHSTQLKATDADFNRKIRHSLSDLSDFPRKHRIVLPQDNKQQISKDKHTAYAVVLLKGNHPLSEKLLKQFKSTLKKPENMEMILGGESLFEEHVNKQTETDLYKSDLVTTPIALIILLLVFGSFLSAGIPLILGGGGALMMLSCLYFLGHFFTLSIFTLNIALLLGLCLSLDYALFIISRFRDELAASNDKQEAVAITQATAGHAILFSGLAVFASLSALLIFPVNILFSVATGGMIAVLIAMLHAIIVLPAILSVLGHKITGNLLSRFKRSGDGFWHQFAEKVTRRPLLYFCSILCFLLLLGYPFLSTHFGVSDYHILPDNSQHRLFFDKYEDKFDINELTPITLLVESNHNILAKDNISKLYDLAKKIKQYPLVKRTDSIVSTSPSRTKAEYQHIYGLPYKQLSPELKTLLDTTTGHDFTVMTIISRHAVNDAQTRTLIKKIRRQKAPRNMTIKLTGTPVSNQDLLTTIWQRIPYAILWIMVSTYLILLLLLRSVFLPFKALLMNILSLSASYGALVLIFQEGYLHKYLNFAPQGMLDISLLVIIFCALFGFSMDYEVFLLSRIREAYERLGNNKASIIFGIEKTSRIITSAAIIVISVCCAFLVADVVLVKAFGLGIAVAIFVDAFLIRTILVPATMVLLEKWNWYLPRWLDKILPKC